MKQTTQEGSMKENDSIALRYLTERGARFVLCAGKVAQQKGWQKGQRPTFEEVEKWLDADDENNVGLVPGSVDCIVLDVDMDVSEALREVEEQFGPPLAEVITQSGGRHLFYPTENPVQGQGNRAWKYGDIRGTNGYVVLWDASVVADGLRDGNASNVQGAQIRELFPKGKGHNKRKRPTMIRPEWIDGNRNPTLYNGCLKAGILGRQAIREEVEYWAAQAGLPEDEVKKSAQSGWETGQTLRANRIVPEWSAAALEAAFSMLDYEVRLNVRSQAIEFRNTGYQWPWKAFDDHSQAGVFEEIEQRIRIGGEKEAKKFTVSLVQQKNWMDALVNDKRVDPFADWIIGLPVWDGVPRLDTLLIDLLGAEDNQLNRWGGRYLILGCISRTMNPGCKLDEFPVLIGPQGTAKSTIAAAILPRPEYFSDELRFNADGKERVESLLGKAIVEISEMAGTEIKRTSKP